MTQPHQRRNLPKWTLAGLTLAIVWSGVSFALDAPTDSSGASPERVKTVPVSALIDIDDPAHVVGSESCKECHKSEYAAWSATTHAKNYQRIDSSAGKKILEAYGNKETCLKCHSTPHTDSAKFATEMVGVSCESCHTPAGGPNGWFKVHSDYGAKDMKREDEDAAHREQRLAACEEAGMIRSSNLYSIAKNCYSCHIVADEKLLAADHKPGQSSFDLIPWIQGEVRHNYQVDQSVNAESPSLLNARDGINTKQHQRMLLVVGKMVELEMCLSHLAAIDEANLGESYAGRRGWAGRAEDAFEFLDEEIGEAIDNEHVKAAIAAVEDIELGRKFEDQEAAKAAAAELSKIAQAFTKESVSVDLSDLDELLEDLDNPKGTPHSP